MKLCVSSSILQKGESVLTESWEEKLFEGMSQVSFGSAEIIQRGEKVLLRVEKPDIVDILLTQTERVSRAVFNGTKVESPLETEIGVGDCLVVHFESNVGYMIIKQVVMVIE